MKAVILAAGRGSRMGTLTGDKPKCLVPLGGKPLLQWQMEALRGAGIAEIGIVRGYQPHSITAAASRFFENPRWSQTNMVASLMCAAPWLTTGTCVVSYSDIVYHTDIVTRLIAGAGEIVITYDRRWFDLWKARFTDPLADAETFRVGRNGLLLEIGGKTNNVGDIMGQYMGLLKFTPSGWQIASTCISSLSPADRDRLDMTSLLRRLLGAGVEIRTVAIEGRWCEIDSETDLKVAESRIEDLGDISLK